jgi:hypothetical protein
MHHPINVLFEAIRQDILDDDAVRLLSVGDWSGWIVLLTSKRIIVDVATLCTRRGNSVECRQVDCAGVRACVRHDARRVLVLGSPVVRLIRSAPPPDPPEGTLRKLCQVP